MENNEVTVNQSAEAKPFGKELRALLDAVDQEDPNPKDVAKLQEWFDRMPALLAAMGDVNMHVQGKLIQRLHGTGSGRLAMIKVLKLLRQDLGGEDAPPLERILIDHVLTCWLRLQDVEWRYSNIVDAGESMSISEADWWERRLSAAQRRYLRACETLARVRKLIRRIPALQVNIAAQGGQQVNVAGDVKADSGNSGRA